MVLNNFCISMTRRLISTSDKLTKIDGSKDNYGVDIRQSSGFLYTDYETAFPKPGINSTENHWGIVLGSGTTAPTANDYNLESPIDFSDLTRLSKVSIYPITGNPMAIGRTETFKNVSDSNITVSEVALQLDVGNNSLGSMLWTRQVISPVTIKPGEIKAFTVIINFAR